MQNSLINSRDTKAIIFDFDGVIIDSVKLKTDIFIQCYKDEIDEDKETYIRQHQAKHGGVGRAEKFRHFEQVLFGREPKESAIEVLVKRYQQYLFAQIDSCGLLPGAIDFLGWDAMG
jgi:beta-phosphoglucomutase-like phosphatase (HAD superfamily)